MIMDKKLMLVKRAVNHLFTSTFPSTTTTEEPSIFGEYGLTLLIIASALTLIGLMILCCYCAAHPSGGNGSRRRVRSVLPTHAPPETTTTVTRSQSTLYANKKGQPILKTYKVTTHSSSSGESLHGAVAAQSQSRNNLLLPSTSLHQQHPLPQQQPRNTNPFYEDIPLDTVSAPRNLTHDYYTRQGLRQY